MAFLSLCCQGALRNGDAVHELQTACGVTQTMFLQAVEAKEGLPVEPDSATQASITFQCFFRYYLRLAGMTVRHAWHMLSMTACLCCTAKPPEKVLT